MVKQTYIAPGNVLSPRAQWTLFRVLYDGGESNGSLPGYSVAVGDWSGRRCIAVRLVRLHRLPKTDSGAVVVRCVNFTQAKRMVP